jgi:hypothetical protein
MKKLKIIFLDIDGVLNSNDWYVRREFEFPDEAGKTNPFYDSWGDMFDPIAVENLRKLIERTGAKIVVSSCWRHGSGPRDFVGKKRIADKVFGLDFMQAMWKERNLPGEVIDITPYFFVEKGPNKMLDSKTVKIGSHSIPRGFEIQAWLEANNFRHRRWENPNLNEELDKCPIENYVIIDDDADMLIDQSDNFVQTDTMTNGFNEKCLKRAIEILETPVSYGFSIWRPK